MLSHMFCYIFPHVFPTCLVFFQYFRYIFFHICQYVQICSNIFGFREHRIIIPIGIPYGVFFSALLVALPWPGHGAHGADLEGAAMASARRSAEERC